MPAEAGISFNRKTPAFAGVTNRLSPPHGNRYDRPSPRQPADRHLRRAVRFGAVGTLPRLRAVDDHRTVPARRARRDEAGPRPEEHTSALPSLMRTYFTVFCLNKNSILRPTGNQN